MIFENVKPRFISVKNTFLKRERYSRKTFATCVCRCGKIFTTRLESINKGVTSSCGCYQKQIIKTIVFKHGYCTRLKRDPTYRSWASMKNRCLDPNSPSYRYYGGRGIKICKSWNNFKNFLSDMGLRPNNNLSIERIDNNKGYRKDNCRWATSKDQSRNRRSNKWIEYNGETLILTDWAKRLGAKSYVLTHRIKKGWPIEKVILTPIRKRN